MSLPNGKILDTIVEYRCVLSLPSAEDMPYVFVNGVLPVLGFSGILLTIYCTIF